MRPNHANQRIGTPWLLLMAAAWGTLALGVAGCSEEGGPASGEGVKKLEKKLENVEKRAIDLGHKAGEKIHELEEKAKPGLDKLKDKAVDLGHKAGEKIHELEEKAKPGLDKLKDKAV